MKTIRKYSFNITSSKINALKMIENRSEDYGSILKLPSRPLTKVVSV